jgi:hypothetical protein
MITSDSAGCPKRNGQRKQGSFWAEGAAIPRPPVNTLFMQE